MRLSTKVWTSVNTKSVTAGVIVAFAVVAFAITGLGGRLGSSFDSNIAAHVGSQQITMRQLDTTVENYLRQSGETPTPEARKAYIQNALNQLIRSRLASEEATRMGWSATDLEVAHWIRALPTFQDEKTKSFKREYYERFLKSGQMSELELFDTGRDSIGQKKMAALLSLSTVTPAKLLQDAALRDAVQFQLEAVELKPDAAALKNAKQDAAKKFAADAANQKRLEENFAAAKSEFQHKAQIHVRSILVAWKEAERAQGEAQKRTKEEAKALVERLYQRVTSGESFAKVAADSNDDSAAKAKQGDLGWIDETNIDPATLKAAQDLVATSAKDPVSPVIETPFGFRLVQRLEARPEEQKTLDQVKEILAERLVGEEEERKLTSQLLDVVKAALGDKDPKALDSALEKSGLVWKKLAKPVSSKDRFIEGYGAADSLVGQLFALKNPGDRTGLVEMSMRNFVFRLISRTEGTMPTPEQIKLAQRQENYQFARNFQSQSEKTLYEVYTREKEIRQNPALQQFE
jgi:peptidyl-prolyl cis-trans isomerase D